jgi:hypothetical protein
MPARPAGRRPSTAQNGVKYVDALFQFTIDVAKLVRPLKLLGNNAKPDQNGDKDQPVPGLQPPFDGTKHRFHRSMQ